MAPTIAAFMVAGLPVWAARPSWVALRSEGGAPRRMSRPPRRALEARGGGEGCTDGVLVGGERVKLDRASPREANAGRIAVKIL
ncbi:MAG TPA: hypothetical protein VFG42_04740 [Baekduia sp.]|uniref:hypothetical protein n=1 Tax=Baekduia sp. TaxID=2600305 RepID=UPI002D78FDEA|nr:hypothetical protein [Baekduia sp.]HET6506071.1 hypothetical protein [Baekduia sp.]